MGRNKKKILRDFIDNIPDHKLENFSDGPGTIHKDIDLRLDMQGITNNDEWNLQIQVNYGCKTTSLKPYAPDTVAGPVLVSRTAPLTPEEIRQIFKDTSIF
ncbi:hypothetical protein N657DRAFT_637728 [Parathielavia appendiculata]|uniref:Uncharacterized protein n=1 Tax=Parathielavia appendiculata TaxID=2587402 RepID=A0AAN6TQR4_9PEZI|nr:hypothetical protein N657DRAFT_637728 [Parathielavia appendiculata]